jgi:sugar (pentulose or hexulose) kinase
MSDGGRTLVAGVDSSTQSTKVVVCDADTGEVLRQARGLGRGRAGQGGLPRAG